MDTPVPVVLNSLGVGCPASKSFPRPHWRRHAVAAVLTLRAGLAMVAGEAPLGCLACRGGQGGRRDTARKDALCAGVARGPGWHSKVALSVGAAGGLDDTVRLPVVYGSGEVLRRHGLPGSELFR